MTKILIVDDDANNRAVLSDLLADQHELEEARDGEECLQRVAAAPPDLILLDVLMPKRDGIETLRALKESAETQHIPVIMVTALGLDSQVAVCLDEGAADHIRKPFSGIVVRARVRAALRDLGAGQHRPPVANQRGTLVSLIGAKGGVGTTTAAINLATLWAPLMSTALVELRPNSGTVATQLGLPEEQNGFELLQGEESQITKDELASLLIRHSLGFRVLLGPQPNQWALEVPVKSAEKVCEAMPSLAAATVIDLPSSPMPSTATVLRRSDQIVLLTEVDSASLHAAQNLLKQLSQWQVGMHTVSALLVKPAAIGVSINPDEVKAKLPCPILGVLPPDPDGCFVASRSKQPLASLQPDSLYVGNLRAAAKRLLPTEAPAVAELV